MTRFRVSTVLLALSLVLLVLLLNAAVSFYNTNIVAENMQKVTTSQRVLTQLRETLSSIIDAETGQRGYLLTGQEGYLAPYKDSIEQVQRNFALLDTLFEADGEQKARLDEVKKAYNDKRKEMEQTIALRRNGGLQDAVPLALLGNGRRQMTIIRRALHAMENAEKLQLDEQTLQARRSLETATTAFYATLLAAILTVLALFLLIRRYIAVYQRAEKEFRALNALMANSVDTIYIFDLHGRFTHASKGAGKLLHISPEQIIGKTGKDVGIPDAIIEPFDRDRTMVQQTGIPVRNTLTYNTKGKTLYFDYILSPIYNERGVISATALISRDSTEERMREEQAQFLSKASEILSSSLDYATTLTSLANLVVPTLAEWCTVHIKKQDGGIEELALAHADPDMIALAREYGEKYPPNYDGPTGIGAIIRTGKPEIIPDITDEMLEAGIRDADQLAFIRNLHLASYMAVPLTARGRTLGVISFFATTGQRYTDTDLVFAQALAGRAALAVDNARLYQESLGMLHQIQDLNEGLEEKVRERTRELQLSQERDRANLHRLKSMLAQLPMAALMMDERGNIIELNEQYCRTFHIGLSAAEAMALPTSELNERFKKSLANVEEHMSRLAVTLERKKPLLGYDIHLRDGRVVQRDFLPFYDNGKFGGQLFLYRDVTQERRIDAAKSEFMSLASHQLKTPLTSIRWVLSRLQKVMSDAIDPAQNKLLAEGRKGVLRMSDTIDTMLQISRIESGQTQLKPEPIAVYDFVRKILQAEQSDFAHKRQRVELDCDPAMALKSDPRFLREILSNLLNNAMKYTPDEGMIKIVIRQQNDSATFFIHDSGYGIPAHQQSKIFSKFFRADNVVGKVTEGTGLGLYLVYLLTKLLGGTIFYESSEGRGTTFMLTVPG